MLSKFRPSEDGNISSVSPHRSFNVLRGIVYNRDLYEFEADEILNMCPAYVNKVRKLRGTQNAIELSFTCANLPEFIDLDHVRLWVKPFKYRPTQCYKCFEYGHVSDSCSNTEKCYICSSEHSRDNCSGEKYCFHCEGNHSPNWRNCPQYLLQKEIINTANNNHISLGQARRLVIGPNKSLGSSFASAVKVNKGAPRHPTKLDDKGVPNLPTKPDHITSKVIQNESRTQLSGGLQTIAVCAEVHQGSHDLNVSPTPNTCPTNKDKETRIRRATKSKENMSKETVKSKSNLSKSPDGFQSPHKTKKARTTSPKKIEIETSNKFEILELPQNNLVDSQSYVLDPPQNNLVRSQSCSSMGDFSQDQNQSKSVVESMPSPLLHMEIESSQPITESSSSPSLVKTNIKSVPTLNNDKSREPSPPSSSKGKSLPGSKLKRHSHLKPVSGNVSKAQSNLNLAGPKK